jgi:hypothetical protein
VAVDRGTKRLIRIISFETNYHYWEIIIGEADGGWKKVGEGSGTRAERDVTGAA